MLDVFPDSQDSSRALAYMDGRDAALFRSLVRRLGSEEKVQNGFILMGVVSDLERSGANDLRVKRAKSFFPEYVGVSFESFSALLCER